MKRWMLVAFTLIPLIGHVDAQEPTLETSSQDAYEASIRDITSGMKPDEGQALVLRMVGFAVKGRGVWFEEVTKVTQDPALFLDRIQPLDGLTAAEIMALDVSTDK